MTKDVIIDQLITHEGLKFKPYKCSSGKLTIGVGRNLDANGITKDEALYLLENDIATAVIDLQKIFDGKFWVLPEIVQRVLVDMRFNLGSSGFRSFKRLIAAVKANDFHRAAIEMHDSLWFIQVGKRGIALVDMMLKAS